MSTPDDTFGRQSQALSRALQDLLADVPDATDGERAAHVTRITDQLTEDWHADDVAPPERAAGTCARCGLYAKNGTVHWVSKESGPDARLIIHTRAADCGEPRQ